MAVTITLPFETVGDLARAVKETVSHTDFMAFPYNPYRPDESDWWISPEKDNPAYRHGKYVFNPTRDDQRTVFVGVHVEKGFGPTAAAMSATARDRRQIMDPDWFWHRFLDNFSSGTAESILTDAASRSGESMLLEFAAFFWEDPTSDFEPYDKERENYDLASFEFDGESFTCCAEDSRTPCSLLDELVSCTSSSKIGDSLRNLPNEDWVWVNAYIGTKCRLDSSGSIPGTWPTAMLWERLLEPFWPWFQ